MKYFLLLCSALISLNAMSQESFTEADARGIVDEFFAGFHEGDTLKMSSVMIDEVPLQSVYSNKKGEHKISKGNIKEFLVAIANRPEEQKWDERLLDYKVQIDGNLAHVWTPYEFWVNGNFSHCGANAFTLAKTDDGWKIIQLIDSRRKSSCKE